MNPELTEPNPVYTIERHEHGLLVRGSLPLSEIVPFTELAEGLGYDLVNPGISSALRGTLAAVNAESGRAWADEINKAAQAATDDPLQAWLASTDVGISSRVIAHVLSEGRAPLDARFGATTPQDADDFGRCLRLVEVMETEEWSERLEEVSSRYPAWCHIIDHWEDLVRLYRSEDLDAFQDLLEAMRPPPPSPEEASAKTQSLELADEWDPEVSKGAFGKRSYFHCLASHPDGVIVLTELFPGRGIRVSVSPPTEEFNEDPLVAWAVRDDSDQALAESKELGDRCYSSWLNGELDGKEAAQAWVLANVFSDVEFWRGP